MAVAKLDITFGRPELKAVRKAARTGNWPAVLASLTGGAIDRQDICDRVDVAASTLVERWKKQVPTGFSEWARQNQANPLAHLLRGAAEVGRAWRIRGYGSPADTTAAEFAGFHAVLQRAEASLRTAAYLDPASPSPWRWLLHTARGQQVGLAETMRRRSELVARHPEHFLGHYEAIESICPRWGSDANQMYACLDEWLPAAAPNSLLHGLVFVANVERRLRDDPKAPVTRDPDAKQRACQATESMRMSRCTRPDEFWAHNYAAAWYSLIGDTRRARAHFRLLRGYCTIWPWEDLAHNAQTNFFFNRITVAVVPSWLGPLITPGA